jgi:S-adenosylmethionine hydrolase
MGCEAFRRFGKTCTPIRQSAVTCVTSENAETITVTTLQTSQQCNNLQCYRAANHNNLVTFTVTTLKTSKQRDHLEGNHGQNPTRTR